MDEFVFSPGRGTAGAGVVGTARVDLELHVVGTIGYILSGRSDYLTFEGEIGGDAGGSVGGVRRQNARTVWPRPLRAMRALSICGQPDAYRQLKIGTAFPACGDSWVSQSVSSSLNHPIIKGILCACQVRC